MIIRNLVIHRRSVAKIAKAVGITEGCVRVHMTNIKKKLGFAPGPLGTPMRPTEGDPRTPTQKHVMVLLGTGMRHAEIAAELGIKPQSVANALFRGRERQRKANQPDPATLGTMADPMFQ